MNVCLFLTSSRHFPLNWQASRVQRPQCVFHGKRTVSLFRPNQPAKGLSLSAYWKVLISCVYSVSEKFRLMFIVNSWVYLVYRRHFVIVRHHWKENAEQVLLFLWHKRGWFWPFVCTLVFKSPYLCLCVLSFLCSFPPSLSERQWVTLFVVLSLISWKAFGLQDSFRGLVWLHLCCTALVFW